MPRSRTTVAEYLRVETVGGAVLLVAAALALVVANSPLGDAYDSFLHTDLGPLDLAHWVSEGLLAVFFFVAGLEVKRELVVGELNSRRTAALPVVAAFAGMVVPALVFLLVAWGADGAGRGWAVPVATDIAFALGVLAIAREKYPASLRVLLLSLAVVDDLGAILLIALLFASGVSVLPLLGAIVAVAAFRYVPVLRLPLALLAWWLVHLAGVHATVAAVAVALVTPIDDGERYEHALQPWSAGVVVPLFAFTAAGVTVSGSALGDAATDRIAVAVFLGLLVGKVGGIVGGIALAKRLGVASVPDGVTTYDTVSLGALGGVGFTVSLLLAELAFAGAQAERAKTAVLAASVVASLLATALLHRRRPSRTSPPPDRAG